MSSFVRFVLKYKKEQSPWGDVARDMKQDTAINHNWNWWRFNKYLEENHSGGSVRVYAILTEMRDAYEQTKPAKKCLIVDDEPQVEPTPAGEFQGHPYVEATS